MSHEKVFKGLLDLLNEIELQEEYKDEESGLQPHLESLIAGWLQKSFNDEYQLKISVGGGERPRVDLLGTNFWPDIEISYKGKPVIAVEVKYMKSGFTSAITNTIGQCLIYKLKYAYVIGFIVYRGSANPKLNEYDAPFYDMIEKLGFPLLIRA